MTRLAARIRTVHAHSRGSYGSPSVTQALKQQGQRVNEKHVDRIMSEVRLMVYKASGLIDYESDLRKPVQVARQPRSLPEILVVGWDRERFGLRIDVDVSTIHRHHVPAYSMPTNKKESAGGFTYLGVLFAVALMGIALAATGTLWSALMQREKERELLFIGNEFRKAIQQYYDRSPGVAKRYPARLEDLLQDDRHLTIVRHLRRVYRDPMTKKAEWGIVESPFGGIMGVYSLSGASPIKKANFPELYKSFEDKKRYDEWKFVYDPLGVSTAAKEGAGESDTRSDQSAAPAKGFRRFGERINEEQTKDVQPDAGTNRPAP